MQWFYQHNNLNNNNDNNKECNAHLGLLTRWGFHAKQPRKGDINGQRKATLPCQWCLPPLGQQHELLATALCMHTLHVHTSKTLCVTGTEVPSRDITQSFSRAPRKKSALCSLASHWPASSRHWVARECRGPCWANWRTWLSYLCMIICRCLQCTKRSDPLLLDSVKVICELLTVDAGN